MSYYPTIDEDIERAKRILEVGKMTEHELGSLKSLPEDRRKQIIENSGSIYIADSHAAYKLLESFVEEIERLRKLVGPKTDVKVAPAKPKPPEVPNS